MPSHIQSNATASTSMSTPTENAPSLDELADLTTKPPVPELYAETDNSEGFISDYTYEKQAIMKIQAILT